MFSFFAQDKIPLLWWKAVRFRILKKENIVFKINTDKNTTSKIWLWLHFDVRPLEPSTILEWACVLNMEYQELNQ